MKLKVEIFRIRTVETGEAATVEIDVPDQVPEGDRVAWIMDRLTGGGLETSQSEFETTDEKTTVTYGHVFPVGPQA